MNPQAGANVAAGAGLARQHGERDGDHHHQSVEPVDVTVPGQGP
jgi:hypothetical protein